MTITLKKEPLPCSSGYTIDAYCRYDNPKHEYHTDMPRGAATFFGQNEREARKEARLAGWSIGKDWFATCPLCLEELKK